MMNSKEQHIEHLLQLFMQGESTLEQESELSLYFATTSEVPEQWLPYKQMFAYFDEGMPLPNEGVGQSPFKRGKTSRPVLWWSLSAAAVTAIAVMVFTLGFKHSPKEPASNHPQVIAEASDTSTTLPPRPAPITTIDTPAVSIAKKIVSEPAPLIAKQEKVKPAKKHMSLPKPHLDSVEIEREQGQVELAQQELLASRIIIEQEREQLRNEQRRTRANFYMARQELQQRHNATEPQAIQVVFK